MGRSSSVISFILQWNFEDSIQPLLPGSCVFWNSLDTVAVKLQGWSKWHLKFGSCGKSQKSNKHSEYFSLSRYFQHAHSVVSVCVCILLSAQVIARVTVMRITEMSRLSPASKGLDTCRKTPRYPFSLCLCKNVPLREKNS